MYQYIDDFISHSSKSIVNKLELLKIRESYENIDVIFSIGEYLNGNETIDREFFIYDITYNNRFLFLTQGINYVNEIIDEIINSNMSNELLAKYFNSIRLKLKYNLTIEKIKKYNYLIKISNIKYVLKEKLISKEYIKKIIKDNEPLYLFLYYDSTNIRPYVIKYGRITLRYFEDMYIKKLKIINMIGYDISEIEII